MSIWEWLIIIMEHLLFAVIVLDRIFRANTLPNAHTAYAAQANR